MIRSRLERLFWAGGALVVVVYALVPVAWIVSLSLKKPADLADNRFLPRSITFENYRTIFGEAQFTAALRNSIGVALIATASPWSSPCSPPTPSCAWTSPARP